MLGVLKGTPFFSDHAKNVPCPAQQMVCNSGS